MFALEPPSKFFNPLASLHTMDQIKKFSLHREEVHLNNSENILKETELKFEAEREEITIQTLTNIENMDIKKDFGSCTENKTLGNPDPLDTVDPKSSVSNIDILNCEIKCELKESSIDESSICEKDEICSSADDNKETIDELEFFYANSGDKSCFDSDSEDEIKDLDGMPLKKRKLNAAEKAKRLKHKTVKNEMSSDESKDADDNKSQMIYIINKLDQVLKNQSEIAQAITKVNNRLDKMEKKLAINSGAHSEELAILKQMFKKNMAVPETQNFPIRSDNEITVIEQKIQEDIEKYVSLIKIIISPGGLADNFAKIIDLNMILTYNYDGTQNKKSFKEFKLLNMAIFEAINCEGFTEKDYAQTIRNCFKIHKARHFRKLSYNKKNSKN